MKVQVGWDGLKGALHGLDELPRANQVILGRTIRSSTREVRRSVRSRAPGRKVRAGVKSKVTGSKLDTVGRVYLVGIAVPVARGAKPHEIAPRTRRALKMGDRFASRVDHPGTRPNPFFHEGVDDALPAVDRRMEAAGVDILGTLASSIDADK